MEGLLDSLNDDHLFPPNTVNMVVRDDLMDSACESSEIKEAFTKYVNSRNVSIMYIVKNVFCQRKRSCVIILKAKYMVLFKNIKNKLQVVSLVRYMYLGKSQFFPELGL